MTRTRSVIAGMTDYTGVPLEDIVNHLRDWSSETTNVIETLTGYRRAIEREPDKFEFPKDIVQYIDYFIDLFTRYRSDLDRVLAEIPASVRETHIEILQQLLNSSDYEEERCIKFKTQHISHRLPDESARLVLDDIYAESRSMLIDYRDLSNLLPRLRTFIGPISTPNREIVQLKPGIWGVSVDIRQAMRTVKQWWNKRARRGQAGS